MQRLATLILVVVAGFVLAVGAVLVARTRLAPSPGPEPPPTRADLTIREVRLQEESGKVRWRLRADQASVFEGTGRTALKNVELHVDEGERKWTLVAEEGDMHEEGKTKRVEVRNHVVLTSDDGLKLETSVLRWDSQARRIWTDAPVRITRGGSVIQGTALDVRMAEDTTTVSGRVRATFEGSGRR